LKVIRSCDIYTFGLSNLILQSASNGEVFMTARSGADSGNDDEEEDGGSGVAAPAGFTDRG